MNGVVGGVANGGGDRGREGGDGVGSCDDGCSSTVLEEVRHQVAAEYLPVMAVIREQLLEELSGIERAEVMCAFFIVVDDCRCVYIYQYKTCLFSMNRWTYLLSLTLRCQILPNHKKV